MKNLIQKIHQEQTGAVALLCLAGILITMMTAWVIYDTGIAGRSKIEIQAAADSTAISMSAVKARSMNMVAYANVAKRSIASINAVYLSSFMSLAVLTFARCAEFAASYGTDISAGMDCVGYGSLVFFEFIGDFESWSGVLSNLGNITSPSTTGGTEQSDIDNDTGATEDLEGDIFDVLDPFDEGDNTPGQGNDADDCDLASGVIAGNNVMEYHLPDLRALDNYQLYTMAMGSWWAMGEGMMQGLRNNATTVGSWPPPYGSFLGGADNSLQQIINEIGGANGTSYKTDVYPYRRMSGYGALADAIDGSPTGALEKRLNILWHINESDDPIISSTDLFFEAGVITEFVGFKIALACVIGPNWGDDGLPFQLNTYSSEPNWLMATSYLALAYKSDPDKFGNRRTKYGYIPKDYETDAYSELTYRASGNWAMARAEISYQGDEPSAWVPGWTARMRPIALEDEWEDSGQSLTTAYHAMLPFLGLTALLGGGGVTTTLNDLVYMERASRAFGPSTIEGIGK